MPYPPSELAYALDEYLDPAGTLGYIALINGSLTTVSYTASATTDELTTATPHNLVTGSRFRVSTTGGGVLAGGLVAGVDYFAAVTSATTLQPCATLADALAATPINLSSDGLATQQLTEQALLVTDPLTVLINHELSGNGYSRAALATVGSASSASSPSISASKTAIATFTASGGDLVYKHILSIRGGTSTTGNTTGNNGGLITKTSEATIAAGNSEPIPIKFFARNAT